ncbi:Predicted acetyltransferase, GNAT family [Nocardioides alpinus]|uniref:GNAT family N-acetyltransferase n=1 Tax=Nocardioides alpinus TaxID=748909 RepID=A0A1I0XJY6_9ACTN|nr:GNAT family N-acetyltransferase [Nocardioides alpinus]PKH44471.1 GNAT family N-acetyltransferase [Nocardioides alpinus]SFB00630.1 Predicted acetyltransferase, GNAT family [Nocardioides alpinus]
MDLEFFDTPQPFLEAAGELLRADPVLGSVIASVSERTAREIADGHDSWAEVDAPFARWWLAVRDDSGAVVSAAMRTAPFKPYPTFGMPMSDEAARTLAAALHDRGELLGGANGALPGAGVLAAATAELVGGELVTDKATRLWEATSVVVPPAPEGRLRPATEDDAALVLSWFTAFHAEADEQAGREPDPTSGEHNTLDSVLVRIREGVEWLWELPDGTVAHLTGAGLPSYGVARIGPVYTPREHRGRGIASYAVGELTRRGLEAGSRMCLFTDQDNPTSHKIYAGLGYEPVVDMAEHLVRVRREP